jgi:hypothetical protein
MSESSSTSKIVRAQAARLVSSRGRPFLAPFQDPMSPAGTRAALVLS